MLLICHDKLDVVFEKKFLVAFVIAVVGDDATDGINIADTVQINLVELATIHHEVGLPA